MSLIRNHSRVLLVALCCVALGAGASVIASAGAATGNSAQTVRSGAHHGLLADGWRRLARRSVQGNLVLSTKQGFVTVTFERGKVDSVSGQQLTLTEGTRRASYKTVTLTIPANARIRANRQKVSLSALTPGQRVLVVQGPKRTLVFAHTPKAA